MLVTLFVVVYVATDYFLYGVIIRYLRNKPRGLQTFTDVLNIDLLQIIRAVTIFNMTLNQI